MPVVMRTLRAMPKRLGEKRMKKLEIKRKIGTVEATALLKPSEKYWSIEKTCCHLIFIVSHYLLTA